MGYRSEILDQSLARNAGAVAGQRTNVKWAQSALNRVHGLRLPVTGAMTRTTRSALRNFQRRHHLPVSGALEMETEQELISALEALDRESAESASAPGPGLRQRILETAKSELSRWGGGSRHETDPAMRDALRGYWAAVGVTQDSAEQAINEQWAWSAAFVSSILKQAGAGDSFAYNSNHAKYIAAAKAARQRNDSARFSAYAVDEVKPEPGDLVCRDRGSPCGGTTYVNVDDGNERLTHCDIVTEVRSDSVTAIGGNTGGQACSGPNDGCTVSAKSIKLDSRGYVAPGSGCKYFALVKPPGAGELPSLPAPVPVPVPVPSVGSRRESPEYTRWVQRSLNRILGLRLAEDGIAGPATRSAVRSFQRKRGGLAVDGVVGAQTEAALIAAGAGPPPTGGSPAAPSAPSATPDIVSVKGIQVARQIAPNLAALLAAAESDGVGLSGWGYRSVGRQVELRRQNCGTSDYDIYQKPSSQCTPPTAPPGRSMHEQGLAIDFTYRGSSIKTRDNPGYIWLAANAGRFGLKNLPSEPWHWSTNGR